MKTNLTCPCGEMLQGSTEDELVARAQEHLRDQHPEHEYTRDQILLLAW